MHDDRVETARSQWRVLVIGPSDHAPQLLVTLRSLDPDVSVDRAESIGAAEQNLRSPVQYDAAFVLDTITLGPDEHIDELTERLAVGPNAPPLVAVTTSPPAEHPVHLDPAIPVVLDAGTINLRQLIRGIRTARDLHRSARLRLLIAVMQRHLTPDHRGHIEGLQAALDSLPGAIDVLGAHLSLSSRDHELRWELSAGEEFSPGDEPSGPDDLSRLRGTPPSASPILTMRRATPAFNATLQLGPLSIASQARVRDDLSTFLDLVLEKIQLASDQRAADRAGIVHHLFDDSADAAAAPARPSSAAPPVTVHPTRELLLEYLPDQDARVIDALVNGQLTILHQPISRADGTIVESDMLLGVNVPQSATTINARLIDLSPLDSLDARSAATVIRELIVPAGHWLISTALPTLQRLLAAGDLGVDHRIHLGLLHRQLADPETVDLIIDLMRGHDIDPRSLAIDVAEPTLIEHHDTIAAMSRLADLGIDLFLDGFGGAGSNFTLLRTPLVRGVRLSRQMVRGISVDDREASIVSGLITLCDELGLDVIATGVDHRADFDWLTERGHVNLQGALIGPALTEGVLLGDRIARAS